MYTHVYMCIKLFLKINFMEKKDCVLSVRCTFYIKNQLVEEAKLLGITLSEYAEMCILKFLKEGEQDSSLEKRILQLEQEKNDLFNQIKELQEELTEKNNKNNNDNDKSIEVGLFK